MKGIKVIVGFAAAGLLISLVVFAVAFWVTDPQMVPLNPNMDRLTQHLMLIFCPPSIGLMAMENADTWLSRIFIMFLVATQNTVLYGLLGALIAWIWRRFRASRGRQAQRHVS